MTETVKRRGRPTLFGEPLSRSEIQRRHRDRIKDKRQIVTVEVPVEMLSHVDLFGSRRDISSRSEAIRELISEGLKHVG